MSSGSALAWALLEASGSTFGSIRVRETDIETPAGRVFHALDTEGRPHLLIPLDPGREEREDRRSGGVWLVQRTLIDDGRDLTFLDVECRYPHLRELFSILADEMLDAVKLEPAWAPDACRKVLERWRELLERSRPVVLGPERLAGLMGELMVLKQLAAIRPGGVLDAWAGPDGARFDFMAGTDAIEVKTTLGREGRSVEIHGHLQLEEPAGGSLLLAFLRMEEVPTPGIRVSSIIDELVGLGLPRLDLLEKLARAGYSVSESAIYDRMAYGLLDEAWYGVDDGFPRIIPRSFIGGVLPAGISALRYRVELGGMVPQPLSAPETATAVAGFLRQLPGG
jgi:hypothetical protein